MAKYIGCPDCNSSLYQLEDGNYECKSCRKELKPCEIIIVDTNKLSVVV